MDIAIKSKDELLFAYDLEHFLCAKKQFEAAHHLMKLSEAYMQKEGLSRDDVLDLLLDRQFPAEKQMWLSR